ncbi:MAG: response regulator, partial [Calditerrivibrio sp.]|nr:response regulator [Calditerrivibrio sp.]
QDNTKNCIGDEYQISQVIENLIINARHATSDKGDIYIKICNHEVPQSLDKQQNELLKPGIYVKITIEDNGVGIPAENINKIFEPFYTTKSKGKGIGLAISHNIIKKHNGVIRVESEAGKFTRFDIYLPATDDKEEKQIEKRYEKEGSLLTIALMDDEFFILDSSKLLLETLGHNVLTASRGEELIEIYRDYIKNGKDIDIFILDVTIVGGMGGIETIKELKKINPDVKAIVSSGYSDDPVFTKYREYGFAATLKKPYNIAEMSEAIKVALENG